MCIRDSKSCKTNPAILPMIGARIKIAVSHRLHDISFVASAAANATAGLRNVRLVLASVNSTDDSDIAMYNAITIANPTERAAATFSRFTRKAVAKPNAKIVTPNSSAKNKYHSLSLVKFAIWNSDDAEYNSDVAVLAPSKNVFNTCLLYT